MYRKGEVVVRLSVRNELEYFTSDWHVGHKNILNFCDRKVSSLDDMHHKLIKRYNGQVTDKDTVWFLGDFGMGKVGLLKEVLSQLNGTKLLILGNHDRGMTANYNIGFKAVTYSASIMIQGNLISMSHCPLLGIVREAGDFIKGTNWHGDEKERFKRFTVPDEGQYHLHGHIHSHPDDPLRSVRALGRQFDVGVDANNMMPVSKGTIESWIKGK